MYQGGGGPPVQETFLSFTNFFDAFPQLFSPKHSGYEKYENAIFSVLNNFEVEEYRKENIYFSIVSQLFILPTCNSWNCRDEPGMTLIYHLKKRMRSRSSPENMHRKNHNVRCAKVGYEQYSIQTQCKIGLGSSGMILNGLKKQYFKKSLWLVRPLTPIGQK